MCARECFDWLLLEQRLHKASTLVAQIVPCMAVKLPTYSCPLTKHTDGGGGSGKELDRHCMSLVVSKSAHHKWAQTKYNRVDETARSTPMVRPAKKKKRSSLAGALPGQYIPSSAVSVIIKLLMKTHRQASSRQVIRRASRGK